MTDLTELAKYKNRISRQRAEEAATDEENRTKREFGRIFETNHATLRLVERNLKIERDAVRPQLLGIVEDEAVLFHQATNTFIPVVRRRKSNRADDWLCLTAYEVDSLEEAQRKAGKRNAQLIIF